MNFFFKIWKILKSNNTRKKNNLVDSGEIEELTDKINANYFLFDTMITIYSKKI